MKLANMNVKKRDFNISMKISCVKDVVLYARVMSLSKSFYFFRN